MLQSSLRSRPWVALGAAALCLALSPSAAALTLSGRVLDGPGGQPVAGALVLLEGGLGSAQSAADGGFQLELPAAGELRVSASAPGYLPGFSAPFDAAQPPSAPLELRLEPQPRDAVFHTLVTSTRASSGRTPASFDNLDAAELKERYWGQDLPVLLEDQPGVYSTSDAGNGVGYTYLSVRGFDQKRVGVLVNGVPLNDPGDHQVYWVDLPDLASSLQDVQLQRGLGFNGASSFGGTVNLLTEGRANERQMVLSGGLGSYGTRRLSLQAASGLIDNKYSLSGRFSRVQSDGYRDLSATELWAYFVTAARYGPDWSLSFTTFGGQEETQQAFNGIPRSLLDAGERRLNLNDYYEAADSPGNRYPHNVDFFQQPHYQARATWTPTPALQLESTVFYVQGYGYYENYKSDRDLLDFGFFSPDGAELGSSDLIRRKQVDKQQLGWLGQADYGWHRLHLRLGWHADEFRSQHAGRVLWAAAPPPDQDGWPQDYYRYDEDKTTLAGYLQAEVAVLRDLRLVGEGGLRRTDFRFAHQAAGNFGASDRYAFDDQHLFFLPRLGLLYDLAGPEGAEGAVRKAEVYLTLGSSGREPATDDYWDAWAGPDDLGQRPLFGRFAAGDDGQQASDPQVRPERLLDAELGGRWSLRPGLPGLRRLRGSLTLYWMQFRDEIVAAGGVDDDGQPIKGNVDSSVHRGVELSLSWELLRGLELGGSLSLSQNEAQDFVLSETVWSESGSSVQQDDVSGRPLPGFPSKLGRVAASYRLGPAQVRAGAQYVGRRYLDFSGDEAHSVAGYWLLDAGAGLELERQLGLERIRLDLNLRNLLDARYETHGWWDAWYGAAGEAVLFPGAGRQIHLGLSLGF